jgi:tRNA-2-methylthio-N6-dimethylallyladenosine synthase
VLGCMAERLKDKFLEEEKIVDIVVGPDAYRSLPSLVATADDGQKSVNVLLSREETYSDVSPVRLNSNGITAFISIMRGCDNMCSFCVVPFTRGRERSRDYHSIVKEATELFDAGYREVTLLGQNVDSYRWSSPSKSPRGGDLHNTPNGEKMNIAEIKREVEYSNAAKVLPPTGGEDLGGAVTFAQLLEKVALVNPLLRVRFSTSHPKDITDEVLYTIKKYDNICKYIHLPIQSGSSRILEKMNRTYTREWYINKINTIRQIIPGCGISTDTISGFCSETEEDHAETLSIMDNVKFDMAYMFKYSERPGTLAAKKYADDVTEEVKARRLSEIIDKQMGHQLEVNKKDIGKVYEVLIEGVSRRSDKDLFGRSTQNKLIFFPRWKYKIGE